MGSGRDRLGRIHAPAETAIFGAEKALAGAQILGGQALCRCGSVHHLLRTPLDDPAAGFFMAREVGVDLSRWKTEKNFASWLGLGVQRSLDRVLQIKAYMKDIFAEAVEQDFLIRDPARKISPKAHLRETDKTTLTWEQLRDVLASLALRDRILPELDMTNALRPSELFALRWSSFKYEESRMKVVETVYKGAIRPWGKNKRSLGWVHLPRELAEDLWLWKEECPDASPGGFIFPDANGGFMDTGNYRKRGFA